MNGSFYVQVSTLKILVQYVNGCVDALHCCIVVDAWFYTNKYMM